MVDGEKVICGRFKTTEGKAVEKIPLPPGLYSSVVSSLVVTACGYEKEGAESVPTLAR
jgi:hypothetical protein